MNDELHEKVVALITAIRESRDDSQVAYMNGSCFHFFKILSTVFPEAIPLYDSNHVVVKIGERHYDIRGELAPEQLSPNLQDMRTEPLWMEVLQHCQYTREHAMWVTDHWPQPVFYDEATNLYKASMDATIPGVPHERILAFHRHLNSQGYQLSKVKRQ